MFPEEYILQGNCQQSVKKKCKKTQFNVNTQPSTKALQMAPPSREFSASNVSVTLHTVNEPWLYSVLWCSGVPSVSSGAPQLLKKLAAPAWLMVSTRRVKDVQMYWLSLCDTVCGMGRPNCYQLAVCLGLKRGRSKRAHLLGLKTQDFFIAVCNEYNGMLTPHSLLQYSSMHAF